MFYLEYISASFTPVHQSQVFTAIPFVSMKMMDSLERRFQLKRIFFENEISDWNFWKLFIK